MIHLECIQTSLWTALEAGLGQPLYGPSAYRQTVLQLIAAVHTVTDLTTAFGVVQKEPTQLWRWFVAMQPAAAWSVCMRMDHRMGRGWRWLLLLPAAGSVCGAAWGMWTLAGTHTQSSPFWVILAPPLQPFIWSLPWFIFTCALGNSYVTLTSYTIECVSNLTFIQICVPGSFVKCKCLGSSLQTDLCMYM